MQTNPSRPLLKKRKNVIQEVRGEILDFIFLTGSQVVEAAVLKDTAGKLALPKGGKQSLDL